MKEKITYDVKEISRVDEGEDDFLLKTVYGSEYNGQFANDKIKLKINNNEMEIEVPKISNIKRKED